MKSDLLRPNDIFDSLKTIQMGLKPLIVEVQARIDEDSHYLTIVASLDHGVSQACLRLDLGQIKNCVPMDYVIIRLRKSLVNIRRSGRTARIIKSSPPNSILIVAHQNGVQYAESLLHKNHRLHDMKVKSLSWLIRNWPTAFKGLSPTTIVFDHDLELSMDDLCMLDEIRRFRHHVILENYYLKDLNNG